MADRIAPPNTNRPIVESGNASKELRLWLINISERALILGEGSPEDVVAARVGAQYADILGTTGSIRYIKLQDNIGGDKTKGWVLE